MHEKVASEVPKHTSENVKPQNSLGTYIMGLTFCICPAPPPTNPLGRLALYKGLSRANMCYHLAEMKVLHSMRGVLLP